MSTNLKTVNGIESEIAQLELSLNNNIGNNINNKTIESYRTRIYALTQKRDFLQSKDRKDLIYRINQLEEKYFEKTTLNETAILKTISTTKQKGNIFKKPKRRGFFSKLFAHVIKPTHVAVESENTNNRNTTVSAKGNKKNLTNHQINTEINIELNKLKKRNSNTSNKNLNTKFPLLSNVNVKKYKTLLKHNKDLLNNLKQTYSKPNRLVKIYKKVTNIHDDKLEANKLKANKLKANLNQLKANKNELEQLQKNANNKTYFFTKKPDYTKKITNLEKQIENLERLFKKSQRENTDNNSNSISQQLPEQNTRKVLKNILKLQRKQSPNTKISQYNGIKRTAGRIRFGENV